MKIAVFGLGYVGSVMVAGLSKMGHHVIGVDIDYRKVELLKRGISPVEEPGVEDLIRQGLRDGTVTATSNAQDAATQVELSMICVGTPSSPLGHPDLSSVFAVAAEIASALRKTNHYHGIVIRSTVPPGTGDDIQDLTARISGKAAGVDFDVVSNPEFLREGSAMSDFFKPPYVIIGVEGSKAIRWLKSVYAPLKAKVVTMDRRTAELLKYVNNAFHAVKVAYANEVGRLAKTLGLDGRLVMKLLTMDRKLNISPAYLEPGFSFGGSCLPKDVVALQRMARDLRLDCPLLQSIISSNDAHLDFVTAKILDERPNSVGILGLTFKHGTDDLRESPAVRLAARLLYNGLPVYIFDANITPDRVIGSNRDFILRTLPSFFSLFKSSPKEIVEASDLLVVASKHQSYSDVLRSAPPKKKIIDVAGCTDPIIQDRNDYWGVAW